MSNFHTSNLQPICERAAKGESYESNRYSMKQQKVDMKLEVDIIPVSDDEEVRVILVESNHNYN